MDIYKLYRDFWDFAFTNPDKIKPNHCAVYSFAIEHCNRLGWKGKFGFPTSMAMEATGIKSYNTYRQTLDDLVEFGFVEMVEKSKNQYSSNIIALSNFDKALHKALDKALTKHSTKQSESTVQSIYSIDKQLYNNTSIQVYNNTNTPIEKSSPKMSKKIEPPDILDFLNYAEENSPVEFWRIEDQVKLKFKAWEESDWHNGHGKKIKNWKTAILNTLPHFKPINNGINHTDTNRPAKIGSMPIDEATEFLSRDRSEYLTGVTDGNG